MTRYLDIMPQQSPTLPRNCNIMRASVVHTPKYHARELKHRCVKRLRLCAKFLLVRNCSWLIHLITVCFFLYFCHCHCLRFVKCASVTNIINLMHGTVSLAHSLLISKKKCFFAAFKGRVTIATSLTFSTNGKI